MKRMTKRLLSWLMVATMVLSMLPTLALDGFAAEAENPGQQAVTAAAAVIQQAKALGEFPAPAAGQTTITEQCPVCGGDREWTALAAGASTSGLSGHYYLTGDITTGIGVLSGGRTLCLNLNGKRITAGTEGLSFANSTMQVVDTVGTGVVTATNGSAVYINGAKAGGKADIYGGTYTKTGSATTAIVQIGGNGGTVNFYAGTIDARQLTNANAATAVNMLGRATGGNSGKATFNLYGGTIYGGSAQGAGGAIRIGDGNAAVAEFNLYGGTVSGGQTENSTSGNVGGNIYVNGSSAALNVYGGTIENGKYARDYQGLGGGNIALASGGKLHMEGGTISGGKAGVGRGGNIFIRDSAYGIVEILGGKIINGEAGVNGDNISIETIGTTASTLTIGGTAQISGGIYTGTNVTTTLTGTPVIKTGGIQGQTVNAADGLQVTENSNIHVSGVTGGEIQVTGEMNTVFSAEASNASAVAKYFSCTAEGTKVIAQSNRLKIVDGTVVGPQVGVFDPENCEGMAYCDACLAQGVSQENALVKWTALSGAEAQLFNPDSHYYLRDDVTFTGNGTNYNDNGHTLCLNLNGNTITATGIALDIGYGNVVNIMDTDGTGAIIGKGTAATALCVKNKNAKVNIYGGTLKRSADSGVQSQVVLINDQGGTVNMYGGTIDAKDAITNAGALPTAVRVQGAVGKMAYFNLHKGTILGGTSSTDGGAVRVDATAQFNMYGGTVSGGTGRAGGNFYLVGGTLHISGGTVSGGKATSSLDVLGGGNILVNSGGTLNIEGGVICGGTSAGYGGNISVRSGSSCTVEISGGKIYGGTAAANSGSGNLYINSVAAAPAALTVSGGEISGDVYTVATTAFTLSGAPQIKATGLKDAEGKEVTGNSGLVVTMDSNIDISKLTTGAGIQVTGDANTVFTAAAANAASVAKCFSSTNSGTKIVAENDQLKIVTKVVVAPEKDVFAPWDCEGLAYCPACMAQGRNQEAVVWTAFDPDTYTAGGTLSGHYYLTGSVTDSTAVDDTAYITPSGTLCFNLDGHDLTTTNGRVFFSNNKGGTLNVMDTAQVDGTVTGYYKTAGGAVFHLSGGRGSAKVNIYGGTFTKVNKASVAASNRSSVVHISANGGAVNMYGGKINTTGVENTIFPTAVYLSGGIYDATNAPWAAEANFTLHDGVITGGSCTGNGGLIRVGNPDIANATGKVVYVGAATFTVNGGVIYGGTSMTGGIGTILNGGNIYVGNDCKLILNGGTVGGDILAEDRTSVAAEGDEELYPGKTTVILSGDAKVLTRYGATKSKATGLYIEKGVAVNADGLTEGAEIYIAGALNEILFESSQTARLKPYIKAYDPKRYVGIEGNGFYLGVRIAAVQTAENQVFYPTADQALAAYYQNPTGAYVQLFVDSDITLKGDAFIDSCGNDVTVAGSGMLYILESANDTYNHSAVGKWTVSGIEIAPDVINPVNGRRYIALREPGKPRYTAHRVELYMTHASLDTNQAGFYYKAAYVCDNTLAARVKEYGIVLSVNGIPRQESFLGGDDKFSVLEAPFVPDANHTVSGTSTRLTGIFKDQEGRPNAEYGARKIYATPYFTVDADGDACYDQVVIGYVHNKAYLENNKTTYTSKSLLDVMTMIDEVWNNTEGFVLEQKQKTQVQEFYQKWSDKGMDQWADQFEHIDAR